MITIMLIKIIIIIIIRELSNLINFDSTSRLTSVYLSLIRFPIALHASWLAAATLLNLNAFFATQTGTWSGRSIAIAHFSAYLAGGVGTIIIIYLFIIIIIIIIIIIKV